MGKMVVCGLFLAVFMSGCAFTNASSTKEFKPSKELAQDDFHEIATRACNKADMGMGGSAGSAAGESSCLQVIMLGFGGYYSLDANTVTEKIKDKKMVKKVEVNTKGQGGVFVPASDAKAQEYTDNFIKAFESILTSSD